jgi:hypothetical protein
MAAMWKVDHVFLCTTHVNFTTFYTPAPSCFLSKHIILMYFNISTCLIFPCIYKYLLNWTPDKSMLCPPLEKHNKASWVLLLIRVSYIYEIKLRASGA